MSGILNSLTGTQNAYQFFHTIAEHTTDYDLKAEALAAGWNNITPLLATVVVPASFYLRASTTGVYAFDTGAGFPAGTILRLINQGLIIGRGGAGGQGRSVAVGYAASAGGPALRAQYPLWIDNDGGIIGGGGGGGGGGGHGEKLGSSNFSKDPVLIKMPGGGGGGGRSNFGFSASGGAGGADTGTCNAGTSGGTGTHTGAGNGGAAGTIKAGYTATGLYAGIGGAGGNWGANGSTGASGYTTAGKVGGSGGLCVVGNSYITWFNVGSRYGALT